MTAAEEQDLADAIKLVAETLKRQGYRVSSDDDSIAARTTRETWITISFKVDP